MGTVGNGLSKRRGGKTTGIAKGRAAQGGGGFPIVGVGASAGGLEAFEALLEALPLDTGMGFVLVPHLDPHHESQLAQTLSRATSLPVSNIANDEPVKPNHVYVIPPDTKLTLRGGVLKLQPREQPEGRSRSIDTFFESLAEDRREGAVGVVLSGTASDGTIGLEAIKAEGGITFAQDDSAKYSSMPRSAVAAGCVDLVLPPAQIAKELARIAKHPHAGGQENAYKKILLLLRNHSGVDFLLYKSTTTERRIARRLILTKQNTLGAYADFLRGNAAELDALYADVLISVTSFFRNPETFDVLSQKVMAHLLKHPGDEPLRCWVLGCSTGQEAYSLAIAFSEAVEKSQRIRTIQIFATDLNHALLDKARHGLYAKSLAEDISPERLRRFFVEEEGGYRVNKSLRDMVVFARQDITTDPPFARIDLISCRNVLIYLEPTLQKKALPTFHYALKPGGFLLLGASESIGGFTDLFEPLDKKHKIYSKKAAPTTQLHLPYRLHGDVDATREADRVSVNQFAPPGVLVNADLQVLQFRGPTAAFLEPPVGKATFDVLKMVHEGLMLPLRSAINEAKKENRPARKEKIVVERGDMLRTVNLEVIPLANVREPHFLILFEEAGENTVVSKGRKPKPTRKNVRSQAGAEPRHIADLESELSEMRDYLSSMREQHDAANGEVQSANEEVQSTNEELQSINEELETSKEELEAANEELTTVNEEMSNRNVELNRLNNDLINFQASTKLAVVLFGRDLTIRRFSPQAEKQFDLFSVDVGRPISHFHHCLIENPQTGDLSQLEPLDLEELVAAVITEVREQERDVHDKAGRWHSLRVRPYLTADGKVDGAVLVLLDVDLLKRSEQANSRLAAIVESSDDAIIGTTLGGVITSWNGGAERLFGYSATDTIGRHVSLIIPAELGSEEEHVIARLTRGEPLTTFETERQTKEGRRIPVSLAVSPIKDIRGQIVGASTTSRDITERKRAEEALRDSEERDRAIVEQVKDYAIFRLDTQGRATAWNEGVKRVLGFDREEFLGTDITRAIFTPEDIQAGVPQKELKTAESDATASSDRWMCRKDGERFFANGTTTALRDRAGRLAGFTKVMRDQTDAVQARLVAEKLNAELRESEERYRAVVEEVKDYAIFRTDPEGRATTWNEGVKRVLGFDREEFLGTDVTETIFTPEDVEDGVPQREFELAVENGTASNDRWMRRKGGHRFFALGTTTSLKEGEGRVSGFTKVMRDHTDMVRANEALQKSEEQLKEYSKDLSEAADRKNEFLAMLGHELRNPLAALSHGLGLLDRVSDDLVRAEEVRGMMKRQTERIIALLDQLLDIARVISGKVELSNDPVDLADIIRDAVETLKPMLEAQEHQLTLSLPPGQQVWALGDAVRLTQIVENILTNAAKYTNRRGRIDVALETDAGTARIIIRDNGIGMSADLLPHVFEVFTQAPRTLDRAKGGLGLGLPLAQRLVEMHGGRVTADSEGIDQGSVFVVTLPRSYQSRRAEQEGLFILTSVPSEARKIASHRILVVDDETDTGETLAELLQEDGHKTLAVGDGEAALDAVRTFDPEVILLDLGLPGMDGYEIARKLRDDHGDKKFLLVAVTGYQNDDSRLNQAGFDGHLIKPPNARKLATLLAKWDTAKGSAQ